MASGFSTGAARVNRNVFVDHLEELRWHRSQRCRHSYSCSNYFYFYHDWVFDNIIARPINPNFVSYKALCAIFSNWLPSTVIPLPPADQRNHANNHFRWPVFSTLSIAFVGGLSAPSLYFLGVLAFRKPALKPNELKNTRFIIVSFHFSFPLGAAFRLFYSQAIYVLIFLAAFQIQLS